MCVFKKSKLNHFFGLLFDILVLIGANTAEALQPLPLRGTVKIMHHPVYNLFDRHFIGAYQGISTIKIPERRHLVQFSRWL